MHSLEKKLEDLARQCPCRWSLVLARAGGEVLLAVRPQERYAAASMIKVPLLYALLRQAAAGRLDLQQLLPVPPGCRVGGAGVLKELRPGLALTVRELAVLMSILSDNTATNALLELVSMEAVNQEMASLGLGQTVLQRRMMDFAAAREGRENYTSAADMARLFGAIQNWEGLPASYCTLLLNILKGQQVRDKLPFYLPEDVSLAHKTGTLPGAEHDGGLLYLPGGPYVACVFTDGLADNAQGLQLVARMGRLLYDFLLAGGPA